MIKGIERQAKSGSILAGDMKARSNFPAFLEKFIKNLNR
jgi:hypothetical protein